MESKLKMNLRMIYRAIRPREKIAGFDALLPLITGKKALEIGGPSTIFERNNIIPVYPILKSVDIRNFSAQTIWGSNIRGNKNIMIDPWTGKYARSLVGEASSLKGMPEKSYDILLSSHVLEHVANPLKALSEWRKALNTGGLLMIVVPDKRFTFDHQRPVTPFKHMLQDYKSNVGEDDMTHLGEILEKHDLSMDKQAGDRRAFENRCRTNLNIRAIHHHVFDETTLRTALERSGFKVLSSGFAGPHHLYAFGRKGRRFLLKRG